MKQILVAFSMAVWVWGCAEKPKCPDDISRVHVLLDSGKTADAQSLLDAWQSEFPNCADRHYLQGALWERKDSFSLAEQSYTEALRLEPPTCPEQVAALAGRSWARIRKEQFAEASADLSAAIAMATCKEAQRTMPWLRFSLANCYAEMNQMSDALTELDSLIPKLNGQMPEAILLRAKVKLALEKPQEALDELLSKQLAGLHQNGTWHWQVGQSYRALGRLDSACVHIHQAQAMQHPLALKDSDCQ